MGDRDPTLLLEHYSLLGYHIPVRPGFIRGTVLAVNEPALDILVRSIPECRQPGTQHGSPYYHRRTVASADSMYFPARRRHGGGGREKGNLGATPSRLTQILVSMWTAWGQLSSWRSLQLGLRVCCLSFRISVFATFLETRVRGSAMRRKTRSSATYLETPQTLLLAFASIPFFSPAQSVPILPVWSQNRPQGLANGR